MTVYTKNTEPKILYKIGTFSKITGASIRTLRYYDEIKLFKPSIINNKSNYRYYDNSQIQDYEIITNLKEIGFTLNEIKTYWNKFDNSKLNKKKKQLLSQIDNVNDKIVKLEYLRSCMHNGKFYLKKKKKSVIDFF